MLCRTAAVRSLAAARAALARSDIPDPPFEGPEVPTKTFFFRFEPQKSIQQMWVQSSKEDFVANRTIVETTSFFGAKCVISSQIYGQEMVGTSLIKNTGSHLDFRKWSENGNLINPKITLKLRRRTAFHAVGRLFHAKSR